MFVIKEKAPAAELFSGKRFFIDIL